MSFEEQYPDAHAIMMEFWTMGPENREIIAEIHHANPGADRTAELDILAMEGGWLY